VLLRSFSKHFAGILANASSDGANKVYGPSPENEIKENGLIYYSTHIFCFLIFVTNQFFSY
jgi:hypothetical protein